MVCGGQKSAVRPISLIFYYGEENMIPSFESLMAFTRGVEGVSLQTLRRKRPFKVAVVGSSLEFTPDSSLTPRRENHAQIMTVLVQFEKTRSFQMSDYAESSFNASYVLALIKHWQNHHA